MTNRTDEVSQLVKALKYEHETLGLTDFDFGVLADNIERIVASAITSAVKAERAKWEAEYEAKKG